MVLLLVTGSASLAESADGTGWAFDLLEASMADLPGRSHVLSGGAAGGPEEWARFVAERNAVAWVEYRADGVRHTSHGPPRRWTRRTNAPLASQSRALVRAACRAARAGWHVRVLALLDPASRCEQASLVCELALAAGLAVDRHGEAPGRPGGEEQPLLRLGGVR